MNELTWTFDSAVHVTCNMQHCDVSPVPSDLLGRPPHLSVPPGRPGPSHRPPAWTRHRSPPPSCHSDCSVLTSWCQCLSPLTWPHLPSSCSISPWQSACSRPSCSRWGTPPSSWPGCSSCRTQPHTSRSPRPPAWTCRSPLQAPPGRRQAAVVR